MTPNYVTSLVVSLKCLVVNAEPIPGWNEVVGSLEVETLDGNVPIWMKAAVLARDGFICQICNQLIQRLDQVTVDHILPIAEGGKHSVSNLRIAHIRCNSLRQHGKTYVAIGYCQDCQPRTRRRHGMGTFLQKPGRWEARFPMNGKRVSFYAKTCCEVRAWLDSHL